MKKSKIFFVSMFIAAALISCSKDPAGNFAQLIDRDGNSSSMPIANNGGNVTCDEVALNTGCTFEFSSGRIDYNGGNGGTFGPITWITDGTYVSWTSTVPLKIAVIVKGGPNANVYSSGCGANNCTTGGTNLSAPINPKNNRPYGLSNITFCYSLCDMVIALKSYMTKGWACTSGGPENISFVGYYYFIPDHQGYKIYYTANTSPVSADINKPVGNLLISDFDNDNLLEVRIDNSDMSELLFTNAYLFVGTLEAYKSSYFTGFPYKTGLIDPAPTVTFDLPF